MVKSGNGNADCAVGNEPELAVDLHIHCTPKSGLTPKIEEKPDVTLVVTAEVGLFTSIYRGVKNPRQNPVVFEEIIPAWRLAGVVGQRSLCCQPRNQLPQTAQCRGGKSRNGNCLRKVIEVDCQYSVHDLLWSWIRHEWLHVFVKNPKRMLS